MAHDVIDQLETLCARLREQLMQQPEYRALVSLEKTIEDLTIYMGAGAGVARTPPAPKAEPSALNVNAMDDEALMLGDPDQLADVMVDGLRGPKVSTTARTVDHLPSHRVA